MAAGELFDHLCLVGVLFQPGDGVITPLTDVVSLIAVPGPLAGHNTGFFRQIQQAAKGADAAPEENVEFGDPEGRRHLVLGHLHLGADAVFLGTAFEGLDPADVQTDRGIELERVATGGRFRVAIGHTDLLAQLVEENHGAARFADVAGDLPHRLAHQAGLAAHRQVTHLSLDLRPWGEGGHRVDHHDVDRGGAHQLVDDLQGHLTGIGLGDQQVFDVHPEGRGIDRIQGVLGIHERRHAAPFLHLGDGMEGERGLAGALRSVDLHHPPLGVPASEGEIQGEGAGVDRFDPHPGGIPQTHDRPLAEIAFNLGEHQAQGLVPLGGGGGTGCRRWGGGGAEGGGDGGLGISGHGGD